MKALLAGAVDRVRVVGRGDMPDRAPDLGPLCGILTLLEVSEADINLVIAVDLPFLTIPFLKYLRSRTEASSQLAVTCKVASQFPLCLGLKREAVSIVGEHLKAGKLSVHRFLTECDAEIISEGAITRAGFTLAIFHNVNTEAEYLRLRPPQT